jgi:hypothetical protein
MVMVRKNVDRKGDKMSFKVGDKVRLISNKAMSLNKIGDMGVIVDIEGNSRFRVKVVGRLEFSNWSYLDDLELVEIPKRPELTEELYEELKEKYIPEPEGDFPQVYKEETYKLAFGTDIITLTRGEVEQLQRKIGELL